MDYISISNTRKDMDIRINYIRLKNFKGARDAEYRFDGGNARIEGGNGSGKSTVFDAFTWLLFGKDRMDQTTEKFELKTIDPGTGETIPNLEHWVEAELTINGSKTVIRRCWLENWVKPTGETEVVLKGHKSVFIVDGVDVGTKRAYDSVVAQWIGEGMFKLLTNPLYFIDNRYTAWEPRRKALLGLVKDSEGRQKVAEDFADLIAEMEGRPLELFRKMVADGKRAQKERLKECQGRIAGMLDSLPEEVDAKQLDAAEESLKAERDEKLAGVEGKLKEIDIALADMSEDVKRRKADASVIYGQITALQLKMEDFLAEGKKVAQKESQARLQRIDEASRGCEIVKDRIARTEDRLKMSEAELAGLREDRARKAEELRMLGEAHKVAKSRAFEYVPDTVCPACGQELPPERVEEARARALEVFNAQLKAEVEGIIAKATQIKAAVGVIDKSIEGLEESIRKQKDGLAMDRTAFKAGEMKLKAARAERMEEPDEAEARLRKTPEYIAMNVELLGLQSKVNAVTKGSPDNGALVLEKNRLEDEKDAIVAAFNVSLAPVTRQRWLNEERKRQLKLIEEKEREQMGYADELARLERLEFRIQEYIKADIGAVEESINSLFRVARWKMFDRTIDGGIVEMCEVTNKDGVPYQSMNDAMKVQCGMDVIRVFGEANRCYAPVFIDNAEGVICKDFGVPAQVIRLCVKDREGLEVIPE